MSDATSGNDERQTRREHYAALDKALHRPHELLDIVVQHRTVDDALSEIRALVDADEVAARAVLNLKVSDFLRDRRREVRDELKRLAPRD